MKTKELKTMTLGYRDNPTVTLCNGHVNVATFNKAYHAEGWDKGDRIGKSDLFHEYWIRLKRSWKKSEQSNYRAQAVTVMHW